MHVALAHGQHRRLPDSENNYECLTECECVDEVAMSMASRDTCSRGGSLATLQGTIPMQHAQEHSAYWPPTYFLIWYMFFNMHARYTFVSLSFSLSLYIYLCIWSSLSAWSLSLSLPLSLSNWHQCLSCAPYRLMSRGWGSHFHSKNTSCVFSESLLGVVRFTSRILAQGEGGHKAQKL